ncbi:Fms-interacting protein-domain-containing protein [Mycena filopes]|nr:Fms-interacting protein-domain-containing protein [Mycena filopes]
MGLPADSLKVFDALKELVDPANPTRDLAAVHIRAAALTGRLKSLARAANTATRATKEHTTAARHDMDQSHLGLQNLLYEKRHLEREIEKCRQFASVYQDIPLYTLDEFKLLAPPEARTEDVLSDEHQLLLNRLSFEFVERQRLDKRKKELMQQKEELLKESKAKVNTMDNVKSQIDTLVKLAADVQKKVDELVLPIPAETAT